MQQVAEPSRKQEALDMDRQADMTPEQSFFAVSCIEALADELHTTGDDIYRMLTDKSDILDTYIVRHCDVLHTQARDWIAADILELMKERGLLQ
jgi:hypothetical protein